MHTAYLLIGSNIQPKSNIQAALDLLRKSCSIVECSGIWKTTAYGSSGPDFLNIVVKIDTTCDRQSIKAEIINPIETQLKRERFPDRNAPRTIDVDIIIYDGEVIDQGLWDKFFITVPVAELLPELKDPDSGRFLQDTAQEMIDQGLASFYANCL
ncbi:MAG TPA: 2-amino-4-hydroxy-6-hydroxymethyldihydropteridine diphosphokinase [Anaerolineaceae bacterium]|uniref:2-amino-4-hydroxy-6-hydroxymethyldihydropteridine diphosphokinase n=1 Tax=Anaerolinea thermophila TaxID=167964 RepID=A0A101FZC8_9CHLR|nr:MAG: 2-amino-4-hydroxy-6-hydroxymethyldihydropteridine pyrophosphokinase [Anaerolinea thermophila]HAF62195.1 2-amino-4-hydroxy-6-hydroxymethyldihydropteridine diphosphokinase [Anaerolineaceae bacterium]